MANTISTAFVNQFSSVAMHLAQQKMSKLRGTVRNEALRGEYGFYDRIGRVAMQEKTTRHADTPVLDTPHSRRRVPGQTWQYGDLIDNDDEIKMLIDPRSNYMQAAAMAAGRRFDQTIIDASFGSASTGKDGSTPVTFPAGQTIGGASTKLTVDLVAAAKQKLDANDVEEEDRFIVISPIALQQLLGETKVASIDYNTVRALVAGEVDTFMGFQFIRSTLLPVATNVRDCLAFQRQGLLLAIQQDARARIEERADKSFATQVYLEINIGAVRMEEERVVKVQVDES